MADSSNGTGGTISLRELFEAQFSTMFEKLDEVNDAIKTQNAANQAEHKEYRDRLRAIEIERGGSKARWEAHKEEHSRQVRNQTGINLLITGVLSGISAWWGGTH